MQDLDEERSRRSQERVEPSSAAGTSSPKSNPAFGEAKATVDEHFAALPHEALGLESADDYVTVYSFERGGKDDLPDDPSRLDRITDKLKTTFWQVQHPTRYAIIQVQPVIEQEAVPGEAPPTPEPTRTQPVVRVIMSATSATSASRAPCSRSSPG